MNWTMKEANCGKLMPHQWTSAHPNPLHGISSRTTSRFIFRRDMTTTGKSTAIPALFWKIPYPADPRLFIRIAPAFRFTPVISRMNPAKMGFTTESDSVWRLKPSTILTHCTILNGRSLLRKQDSTIFYHCLTF